MFTESHNRKLKMKAEENIAKIVNNVLPYVAMGVTSGLI